MYVAYHGSRLGSSNRAGEETVGREYVMLCTIVGLVSSSGVPERHILLSNYWLTAKLQANCKALETPS